MQAMHNWIGEIQQEAMKFVSAVQSRFTFQMGQAEKLLPDPKAFECRAQQCDIFVEALVGVTVNIIGTYLNAHPDTEALVLKGISRKFNLLREMIEASKIEASEQSPIKLA